VVVASVLTPVTQSKGRRPMDSDPTPVPTTETQERAEEHTRLASFDWSFADDEDLVYGERQSDQYVVLPRRWLQSAAELRSKLDAARTWGDLRESLEDSDLEDAVERSHILQVDPYEGKPFSEVPDGEQLYIGA
jgi:hypothetical protein